MLLVTYAIFEAESLVSDVQVIDIPSVSGQVGSAPVTAAGSGANLVEQDHSMDEDAANAEGDCQRVTRCIRQGIAAGVLTKREPRDTQVTRSGMSGSSRITNRGFNRLGCVDTSWAGASPIYPLGLALQPFCGLAVQAGHAPAPTGVPVLRHRLVQGAGSTNSGLDTARHIHGGAIERVTGRRECSFQGRILVGCFVPGRLGIARVL